MNAFKAGVALIAFGLAVLISQGISLSWHPTSTGAFLVSGLIGLNIGDIFLLRAFSIMGSARTLMIFSFQPVVLGIFSYLLFSQTVSFVKAAAILFMIGCVFVTSYEKYKQMGHWDLRGPLYALIGVFLDSCGILLTRFAFDSNAGVTVLEGNFYRCVGAVLGFFVMAYFFPFNFFSTLKQFRKREKGVLIAASLGGTFISLWCYLTAISKGNLATISAITGAGPVFAAVLESIVSRQWPSRYLYFAFALFAAGFYLLL